MNRPDLLLYIHVLHVAEVRLRFIRVPIETVNSCLLSASQLVLRQRLACHRVKDIASLTGQSLEIIGHIDVREG